MASALHAVACHGFSQKLSDLQVLDVLESQKKEQVAERLQHLWEASGRPANVLILTDLLGATPANGVSAWMAHSPCESAGVAGVSLPMLLRALTHRDEPPTALAQRILKGQADCASFFSEGHVS